MSPRLASARAYYRLAGKASRAGEIGTAEHYRKVADRMVDQDRRERETRKRNAKLRALPRPERKTA
jgi:hypothetical protein